MSQENFSALDSQEKLELEMNKIQVNLRAKEFRKNPKGMFMIKPRDLTYEETLKIFEAQIKL